MRSNMARPLKLPRLLACVGAGVLVAVVAGCWDSNPCNPGQMLFQNACFDPMDAGSTATGTGGAGDGGGTGGGGSGGSTTTTGSTTDGGDGGGGDGG
jgi:hypothetical protein